MAPQPTQSIVTPANTQGGDHTHSPKVARAFRRPSLPIPDSSSPLREILDFIEGDVLPECFLEEGHWLTRRQLKRICREFDFPDKAVLSEIRREAFVGNLLNGNLSSEDVDVTPSGIIVNKKAIRAIAADLGATCPYKQRYISVKSFRPYCKERLCDEPWHLPCGVRVAEELYQWMSMKLGPLDQVYVTFCPWTPSLSGRLGQRRFALGMESMTYHRIDGLAFIVSDKAHGGSVNPTSCQVKSPAEAMEWFTEAIYVPGRMRVDWSDGWRPPRPSSNGAFDDIDLTHLTDEQVARVRAAFRSEANRLYGVQIETGQWPKGVHEKLVDLMRKLVVDAGG
jgi:hypothetical protein